MMIARHGGESHYVRPDRVYKTSVLQPIVGFQPQQDVMAVTQAFTQGPYLFMQGDPNPVGQGVAGLNFQPFGFLQKMWMKFQLWRAKKGSAAGVSGLGFTPLGPINWAGGRVVPMPGQRVGMLIAMQEKDQPPQIAMNNSALINARWNYARSR